MFLDNCVDDDSDEDVSYGNDNDNTKQVNNNNMFSKKEYDATQLVNEPYFLFLCKPDSNFMNKISRCFDLNLTRSFQLI